jgi:hypothetical protein
MDEFMKDLVNPKDKVLVVDGLGWKYEGVILCNRITDCAVLTTKILNKGKKEYPAWGHPAIEKASLIKKHLNELPTNIGNRFVAFVDYTYMHGTISGYIVELLGSQPDLIETPSDEGNRFLQDLRRSANKGVMSNGELVCAQAKGGRGLKFL